jgi:hypothetical protein
MDAVMRVVPVDSVFTAEGMAVLTQWVRPEDATAELGVPLRPVRETFADAIRGLHAAGRLTDRQVGRLASEPPGGGG